MRSAVLVAGMAEGFPADGRDVIGVDRGAVLCANRGVRMVMAVGDFDSCSEEERKAALAWADQVIRLNARKDETDTETAVRWAVERYDRIDCYGCLGGRLDHEWANLSLITRYGFPLTFWNELNRICRLESGEYEIRPEGYAYLSFFPLTEGKIWERGVSYPLEGRAVSPRDLFMISNRITGEKASIRLEGSFLMIQSKDEKRKG